MARLSPVFSAGLSHAPVRLALPRSTAGPIDRMREPGDLVEAFRPSAGSVLLG